MIFDKLRIAQIERLLARWPDHVRMLPDGRIEVDLAEEETPPKPPAPVLAPNRVEQGADGTVRKAHYRGGVQPWDKTLASGWGPHAAAFCVLRYLGRDKAPEHSLESAHWYYERLYAGAAGKIESPSPREDWDAALMRLEVLLTKHEIARLRGSV